MKKKAKSKVLTQAQKMKKFADATRVPLDWLQGGEPPVSVPKPSILQRIKNYFRKG